MYKFRKLLFVLAVVFVFLLISCDEGTQIPDNKEGNTEKPEVQIPVPETPEENSNQNTTPEKTPESEETPTPETEEQPGQSFTPDNDTDNDADTDKDYEDKTDEAYPVVTVYTVSFDLSYESNCFTKNTSDKLEEPEVPTRYGYTFLGWYHGDILWNFNDSVTADMTLTAKWEIKKFQINYVIDGGENNSANLTYYSLETPFPKLLDPSKDGAYFYGWYSDSAFTEPFVIPKILSDITVYARFIYTSEALGFEKVNDTYFVSSYCGSDKIVAIPELYCDLPVVGIGDEAFLNANLEKIIIPDSVKYVSSSAFKNCTSLVYNQYNGIAYLGNLKNEYLILVGKADSEIEELEIHNDTKVIADSALCDLPLLSSITGGNSVSYIGKLAFKNCRKLSEVSVFDTVKEIGEEAFYCCRKIETLIFSEELIKLGKAAFTYCENLKYLDLPNNIVEIPEKAFLSCNSLKTVILGIKLEIIGIYAFSEANDTLTVYYRGTPDMWKIVEHNGNFNENFNSIYYYSETALESSDKYWCYENNAIKTHIR